jgi:hypothetical protein
MRWPARSPCSRDDQDLVEVLLDLVPKDEEWKALAADAP